MLGLYDYDKDNSNYIKYIYIYIYIKKKSKLLKIYNLLNKNVSIVIKNNV